MEWLKNNKGSVVWTALLVLCLGASVYAIAEWGAQIADENATKALQALSEQQAKNAVLETAAQANQAQLKSLNDALDVANDKLAQQISARSQALTVQQKKDEALPKQDLAARWGELIDTKPVPLEMADEPQGLVTVQKLETIPVLERNLADTRQIAENRLKQVNACMDTVGSLNSLVSGLKSENALAQTACSAQIAAVKAEGRKSKFKYFLTGGAVGVVLTILASRSH